MCKRRIIWQREQRPGLPGIRVYRDPATEASAGLSDDMADEACRTRSQKRALEKDVTQNDIDNKKLKLETDLLDGELVMKAESESGKMPGLLKSGEVKATIKVEVPTGEEPMDMSTSKSETKREKRVPSPDVIVLSDNEPSSPRMNGLAKEPTSETFLLIQRSSPEERERLIKQLKEELRLEEAKLVLLKKLRQSQIQKETAPQKVPSRIGGTVIPPPLVRGGQQSQAKQSTQIVMPPLVRGAQQMHNIRQHPSTGPPPLLLAPRASVPNVQMQGQRIIQQGLIRVANVANTSLLVNIPQASPTSLKNSGTTGNATSISSGNANDSPASRQAAAKLALRKQLEKTLLEIPPPKPPAPELNFLPSAANNEFIYLVGLEEVVQNLLETQGKEYFIILISKSPTPISRGLSGTTRGVLHTFPPTTKLPNAATLANRSAKSGEHPVNKTNLAPGNWKKSSINAGGTLTYVNPGLSVHKSAAVDRQREYLLDMIPSRSITQSSTWK
ncbi:hypothetical protein GDO81_001364 [Engystomops pustulosus]|uniref:Transcriptional repressor p66 coiled-coil MBD2-interaction domain-containing protein n=1 Tax=Engystomops pustulosus TaxID=76066 RepID=A0AAV7DFG0_ENGPU|nr:hypothetical protein GDO81_001364 [Engystomops pustulosus]